MSADAPVVEVRLQSRLDCELIDFHASQSDQRLSLELPVGTLERCRDGMSNLLKGFKDDVGDGPVRDLDAIRTALLNLFNRAAIAGGSLTGGGPAGMHRLRKFFETAVPDWQTRTDVPLVQVDGPTYGFPFELLPVFDLRNPGEIADVPAFARRFLGFTAAVRRVPHLSSQNGGLAIGDRLAGKPLPVSFAWYASMAGAREELRFFRTFTGNIEINGPWPPPQRTGQAVLDLLADGLIDPRRRYSGPELGAEVQIVHLACHCDTGFRDAYDYELELADDEGVSQLIKLGALNQQFLWKMDEDEEAKLRPLVFLNACGSAHLDPRSVYSWPEFFLQTGHRCVIGPETLVPDLAASQFSRLFYRALFSRHTAGQALVVARRRLLEQFGNPLGLLYVLYGNSAITVEESFLEEGSS